MTESLDTLHGPEYRRLFEAVRRSLERTTGAPTGQISISDPDDAERKALIGLTGRFRAKGVKRIAVSLAELDVTMRATVGLPLSDLVVFLDGKPLRFRASEKAETATARAALLSMAEQSVLHASRAWFQQWLDELGPLLTKLANQGAADRLGEAVRVLEAIEERPADDPPYLLPVLAELATGDTKALGRGTTTATLVLRALALRAQMPVPSNAEQTRLLWDASGVVVDDLASRVLVLNLRARGAGLGEWLTGAAGVGTPFQVTLHQLTAHPIDVRAAEVFVCENPAVLRRAAQSLGPDSPPLLCTEGRPSTAFDRLARILSGGGARLNYHGDFDWDGIDIANGVIDRHGARPWQMAEADYRGATRTSDDAVALTGRRRLTPWEPGLAEAMAEIGVAVYEEAVTDALLAALANAS